MCKQKMKQGRALQCKVSTYNYTAGYDEGPIELHSLDELGETVLPQIDCGGGSVVKGFESFLIPTGQGISGKITKHLGSG